MPVRKRRQKAEGFQIWYFCWSFSLDIITVKGLILIQARRADIILNGLRRSGVETQQILGTGSGCVVSAVKRPRS